MTDDELRERMADAVAPTIASAHGRDSLTVKDRQFAGQAVAAVLPLVRAEIAAAERHGAEKAAQAIEARANAARPVDGRVVTTADIPGARSYACYVTAARLARAAVPAPTGDNA